ncbi:MAG: Ig-like domain-containing protein, partial [Bacteroidota bacterium]|nr:Ig-like domain-containing protein [Bacteroidota bacterium]
ILQSTMILSVLGIFVQASAQPVVVREIPVDSKNFTPGGNYVYFTSGNVLWRTDGTSSGTFSLTGGINQSNEWNYLNNSQVFNGSFYFVNNTNRELWKSDGTPGGTVMLKTTSTNSIAILDATDQYLYFQAADPATGTELYRTDGTANGTELVRDINPGAESGNPHTGAAVGSEFFFFANDGTHGMELWKSNGTSGGTVLVEDINPGPADAISGGTFGVNQVFSYNNLFYFSAGTAETGVEPWVSDGTEAGTMLLKEIMPGPESPFRILYKIQHDGAVYILIDAVQDPYGTGEKLDELWKTSGTAASTIKLATIGEDNGVYNFFCVFKDQVHFVVYENTVTTTLWKTDGTPGGTESYFNYYTVSSGTTFFEPVKDEYIVFYGLSDGFPTPLYRTDGTAEGTEVLTEFNSAAYLVFPREMTKVGDFVLYADHDGLSDRGYGGFPYAPEDYFHLIQTDGENVASMRTMFGVSTIGTNNITDYNGSAIFTTHNDQSGPPESNPKRLWIYEPIEAPRDSATFTLVHAETDRDVRRVNEGANIVQPEYGPEPVNIRYNPVTPPGSVVFKLNDVVVRKETAPPFSLGGDVNGDYSSWAPGGTPGTYKLTATSYSGAGGSGTPGESLTVTFTIQRQNHPEPEQCTASGTILREYWDNVSGNSVSSIPVDSPPTSTSQLAIFEGPTNVDTNYGARIRGYICPPTTGSYTFWIASNDNSELWISTDDKPWNKRRIAFVNGATNPRQWDKFASQKSATIFLNAGSRYYVEALHKQGAGTDNIAVGWQIPGGTMERPIPGNRLSPFTSVENPPPSASILYPVDGETFSNPASITISASAGDVNGTVTKVEFFSGTEKLGEDLTSNYDFVWQNPPEGTHTLTVVATDNEGAEGTSNPVTITVTGSCSASGTI